MDLRLLLLLVAAAAVAAPAAAAPHWGPQWPWPDPAAPGARKRIDAGWQLTLDALWNHSRSTIGFCLGNSQYKAQRVLALSWPFLLPVSNDTSDALCSNATRIDAHLCGPQEIEDYYKASRGKGAVLEVQSLTGPLRQLPPFQLADVRLHLFPAVHAADGGPGEDA